MKDNIIIGKIFNVHGIKGELKVLPLTDDINRFKKLANNLLLIYNTSRYVEKEE